MNKFIKKNIPYLLLLLLCTSILPADTDVKASTVMEDNCSQTANISSTGNTVSPCADITEWHYTVINGKTYRRLYNLTKRKWIGDWELCP